MTLEEALTQLLDYVAPAPSSYSYDAPERPQTFVEHIETGGAAGGSCWDEAEDEGAKPYYIANPDPATFPCLEEGLETLGKIVGTDLSAIHAPCVASATQDPEGYTQNDYYGNYTDYNVYTIPYALVLAHLLPEFKKRPKVWIRHMLAHQDRAVRMLGMSLGTAWKESHGKKFAEFRPERTEGPN